MLPFYTIIPTIIPISWTQLDDGKMAASSDDEQSSRIFDVSWGSYEHSMHLEKFIVVPIIEQNGFIL